MQLRLAVVHSFWNHLWSKFLATVCINNALSATIVWLLHVTVLVRTHQNRDIKLFVKFKIQYKITLQRILAVVRSSQRHCRPEVLATASRGLFATALGSCPFPVEPLLIKVLSYSTQWTVCNCFWQLLLHVWSSETRILNYLIPVFG